MDRSHSLSGQKNLDWFFASRKWVRTAGNSLIEAGWAVRPLPEGEAAIRFLLLAPKRNYKRAHERNKIRRWLRAAIAETNDFAALEESLSNNGKQLLVMLRISKLLREVTWRQILKEVGNTAAHLQKRLSM